LVLTVANPCRMICHTQINATLLTILAIVTLVGDLVGSDKPVEVCGCHINKYRNKIMTLFSNRPIFVAMLFLLCILRVWGIQAAMFSPIFHRFYQPNTLNNPELPDCDLTVSGCIDNPKHQRFPVVLLAQEHVIHFCRLHSSINTVHRHLDWY
jgi:hypothetical protein